MRHLLSAEDINQAISNLEAEIRSLEREKTRITGLLGPKKQEIHNLRVQLEKQKTEEVRGVTDHAVLRYLERIFGLDTDAIRAEILSQMGGSQALKAGDFKLRKRDGTAVVVKDGKVVTVMD